jgi:manganese-dependent inorganic pyrophosphatase
MKPIYIIGHRNPDIDSIASAVAYQFFKHKTQEGDFIAASASELNDDLKWLLNQVQVEAPQVVNNVATRVEDLLDEEPFFHTGSGTTLLELGQLMGGHDVKTIPVLDDHYRLLGLISLGDIAMLYMNALGSGIDVNRSPEILGQLLSKNAGEIMKTKDLFLFESGEKVDEVRKSMLSSRFRNYPVVDDENRYLGMVSRYHLLQMRRKKVILVDHNEKKQAVDGIEEAEILEVIDHHRVGDLQTISPIYFHNEPVGSTSTLIAEMFFHYPVNMSTNLAGLLLAGVMSDTMIFKSPTTTPKDLLIAKELSAISKLDPLMWGKQIYTAIHQIEGLSDREVISEDLKEYVSGDITFAISQVETVDLRMSTERRASLLQKMEELCIARGYALMCLMVTNILEGGTDLLVAGSKKLMVEEAFTHEHSNGGIFLQGVLSRKKQVVPVLYQMLQKERMI